MTDFDTLEYTVDEGRAEIVLDRPEALNAFTERMLEELNVVLEAALDDDSVYAIVLTGAGRGFCSGVDLNKTESHDETRIRFEEHKLLVDSVFRQLFAGRKPTIAAVNGPAVGGGLGFALSCDFRVMSEDAFLLDQHLNIGLAPSTGAGWILPRLIGLQRAKEFVLTGRRMPAEEAHDLGLVVEVTPDGETIDAARTLANDLRDKSAAAMRHSLELLNGEYTFEEYRQASIAAQWESRQSPEYGESIAAVAEKREFDFDREY